MRKTLISALLVGTALIFPAFGQNRSQSPGSGNGANTSLSNTVLPDARTNLGLGTASSPTFAGVKLSGIVSRSTHHVYVATTGNDSSDCLTAGTACATITHAVSIGASTAATTLEVDLAAGAYTESVFISGNLIGAINSAPIPNGTNVQPGQVMLAGAGSASTTLNGNASNCGVIVSSNYAIVGVRAMTLNGNGNACQSTLFAQINGIINIYDDVNFGPASVEQIHIENSGSQVQAWYSYTISGGAVRHINASNGLFIHSAFPSGVITLTGTPNFSDAFASASENGTVQFNTGVTFSGAATGKRFHVYRNGVIRTDPSTSLSWLPGSTVGYWETGGIYNNIGNAQNVTGLTNPAVTTSTTLKMAGISEQIVPRSTGTLQINVGATCQNSTSGDGILYYIAYGTGTPPAAGAAQTGTLVNPQVTATVAAANQYIPCSTSVVLSGLTFNTSYWIDIAYAAFVGGTATLYAVNVSAVEIGG